MSIRAAFVSSSHRKLSSPPYRPVLSAPASEVSKRLLHEATELEHAAEVRVGARDLDRVIDDQGDRDRTAAGVRSRPRCCRGSPGRHRGCSAPCDSMTCAPTARALSIARSANGTDSAHRPASIRLPARPARTRASSVDGDAPSSRSMASSSRRIDVAVSPASHDAYPYRSRARARRPRSSAESASMSSMARWARSTACEASPTRVAVALAESNRSARSRSVGRSGPARGPTARSRARTGDPPRRRRRPRGRRRRPRWPP